MVFDLIRLPDWDERLITFVRSRMHVPYRYGVNDCATFSIGAVEAVTGVDLFPGVDRPTSWIGAAKFLLSRGWEDVEDMMTSCLGGPSLPGPSRVGDLVSFEECDAFHLAVRIGDASLTPVTQGLRIVPSSRWRKSWMVG